MMNRLLNSLYKLWGLCLLLLLSVNVYASPLPFVKQVKTTGSRFLLQSVTISSSTNGLESEKEILSEYLKDRGVSGKSGGFPIRLEITSLSLPVRQSAYRDELMRQGYRLTVKNDGVLIQSSDAVGVSYGIQSMLQILDDENRLPEVEILDWPDLPWRMVMVDPARQNQNAEYYQRLIQFCARYKINRLHVHLTDDQSSVLYHEDYPELMHYHAWKAQRIQDMVAMAKRYHIELIPEIESLGHSSMFQHHPDYQDILHKRDERDTMDWWWFPYCPGYNNVLCPASDKALEYLDKMFSRTSNLFPASQIHAGFDEVVESHCTRCEEKFGEISYEEWFAKHLLYCQEQIAGKGKKMAIWGDVLLKHPKILDSISSEKTIIYDWHYNADVSDESVLVFKEKGFEVMACPALICMFRMIFPDEANFTNIQKFAEIARQQDLSGMDTTIWMPTRYLSDALWSGIAFAACQSWSGSNWDESEFYRSFLSDYFGSEDGEAFEKAWKELIRMKWYQPDILTACWSNGEEVEKAREFVEAKEEEVEKKHKQLQEIQKRIVRISKGVKKHTVEWKVLETSIATRAYTMEHLLASREVRKDEKWNIDLVKDLDRSCIRLLELIEKDWDRNRYADDPCKDDAYKSNQNVLHSFRQMHKFHQEILAQSETVKN